MSHIRATFIYVCLARVGILKRSYSSSPLFFIFKEHCRVATILFKDYQKYPSLLHVLAFANIDSLFVVLFLQDCHVD